ncbi:MAG: KH domain-containing protein, partial [Patescibacteria group bacterium]
LGVGEKIDIIQWNRDEKLFLMAALSPAKITSVEIDKTGKRAKVTVDEKEAPLAIGKGGINVNLASRLTEFEIDIVQTKSETPEATPENKVTEEKPKA